MSESEGAPPPDDLKGWLAATATAGTLERFRREDVVRAARHPTVRTDRRLYNAIMSFLNRIFLTDVSKQVSTGWQNGGQEIVERVHHKLITAVLDLDSADGKQMEKRYWAVVKTRTIDAVREEKKKLEWTPDQISFEDAEDILANMEIPELAERRAEVERVLELIPDERKRYAFRLRLDGVPFKAGKGTTSICGILEVSDKTASQWVAETLVFIKRKFGESK